MPLERLSVVLTDEERSMRAREAARFLAEYGAKEEHKKEVVKELSGELKDLRAQADAAARAANSGVEEREVPVSPRANNERFVVEFYRDDTGDLVRTRPMTDDEMRVARQTVLPLRQTQGNGVELRAVAGGQSPLRGNTRAPINPPSATEFDDK